MWEPLCSNIKEWKRSRLTGCDTCEIPCSVIQVASKKDQIPEDILVQLKRQNEVKGAERAEHRKIERATAKYGRF